MKNVKKYFCFLFLLSVSQLSAQANSNNSDINNSTLIPPIITAPNNQHGILNSIQKLSLDLGLTLGGEFYKRNFLDIKKTILKEISTKEMQEYYPNIEERDAIAQNIADHINKNILIDVNNKNAIAAIEYAGVTLLKDITERVLKTSGADNQERRDLWKKKILTNFTKCTKSSNHYLEADKCLDSLKLEVPPNIGLAIVHELSALYLSSIFTNEIQKTNFLKQQRGEYTSCMEKYGKKTAYIKECVLDSIRIGIVKITKPQIIANAESAKIPKKHHQKIIKNILPNYTKCLNKAEDKNSIMDCVDELITQVGNDITKLSILSNKSIIKATTEVEREILANKESVNFSQCMQENIKQNNRAHSGLINTNNCANRITNEVTHLISIKEFNKNAIAVLGNNQIPENYAKNLLERCWSMNQISAQKEKCLRDTTITFAKELAEKRISIDLPQPMKKEQSAFISQKLSNFESCLVKNLPQSISDLEENILDNEITKCKNTLVRSMANKVAEYELTEALKEHLSPEELKKIISTQVYSSSNNNSFQSCLKKNVDYDQIDYCAILLQQNIGVESAKIIFPKELLAYFSKNEGIQSYKLETDSGKFVAELNNSHEKCILALVQPGSIFKPKEAINECYKKSIKKISLFLGEAELHKNIADLYKNRKKDKELLSKEALASLEKCITEKDTPESTIKTFTDNIYFCADKLALDLTKVIADDQLTFSLKEYIKDEKIDQHKETRIKIKNSILSNLNTCMEKSSYRKTCTGILQKEATRAITLAAADIEIKKQLNSEKKPKKLQEIEDKFTICIKNIDPIAKSIDQKIDTCTKNYIIELTQIISDIKLNTTLLSTLGKEAYDKEKKNINNIYDELIQCLERKTKNATVEGTSAAITVCTGNLQDNATKLVEKKLARWLASTEDNTSSKEFKLNLAIVIPCFSELMPETPYDEDAIINIDPKGVLQELAKTIGAYINYDLNTAIKDLPEVLQKLMKDLESAGPLEARKNLVKLLVDKKILDQLLKSIVQTSVQNAFSDPAVDQQLDKTFQNRLLEKKKFDEILSPKILNHFRPLIAEGILYPVLVNGESNDSKTVIATQNIIKKEIAKILLTSPNFGEKIISHSVQKNINDMNSLKMFFATLLYGEKSLNWSLVRNTTLGKEAEEYIKEAILAPKFYGEAIDETESQKRLAKAEELVTNAVKRSNLK